jgi:acetyl esterase/lipase
LARVRRLLPGGIVVALAVTIWLGIGPERRIAQPTRAEARATSPLYREVIRPRPERRQHGSVVFLHGGGWRGGERLVRRPFTRHTARRFARMGFKTYNVDYRSGRRGVRDAVRWFDALHGRRPRAPIFFAGSSAGAHLALEVARRRDTAGVVGIGTPTDLRAESNERGVFRRFIRPNFRGRRAQERHSPVLFGKAIEEPVLLGHVTDDRLIAFAQVSAFQSPAAELVALGSGAARFPHGGADPADLRAFYLRVRELLR